MATVMKMKTIQVIIRVQFIDNPPLFSNKIAWSREETLADELLNEEWKV